MKKITIYSKIGCPYCQKTTELLSALHLQFSETSLDPRNPNYNDQKQHLFNHFNHHSFPVIMIGSKLIGGYSDLYNLYISGKLQKLL